jgi:hypothetical protein
MLTAGCLPGACLNNRNTLLVGRLRRQKNANDLEELD